MNSITKNIDCSRLGLDNNSSNLSYSRKLNKNSLVEFIKYFNKIYFQKQIDEKQCAKLKTIAITNYINNEVELNLVNSLNKLLLKYFDGNNNE